MIENLKNFFKLVRWFHELLAVLPFAALYLVIRYYAAQNNASCNLSALNFMVLCLCVQMLIAAGCILNDIMDRNIDKINKPYTHTVGRTISLLNAKRLFAAATLLIILLSVYICRYMFIEWAYICLAVYILSILYDVYLKRSPLFGNITMAVLTAFIPLVILFFAKDCIALLSNSEKVRSLIYVYVLFPFLIIIPRELSLDISDMEGDRANGCRTLPIMIGVKKARRVVSGSILFIIVFSVFLSYCYPYMAWVFTMTNLFLLFYLYCFYKAHSRLELIKAGRFLWFIMISGLIGFTLATLC